MSTFIVAISGSKHACRALWDESGVSPGASRSPLEIRDKRVVGRGVAQGRDLSVGSAAL